MRIDRDMTGPDDTTPTLDRVWAATRPPELSADEFDRIWADVQRAHDGRPASLPMTPAAPDRARRRALGLVALGLAQLAAAGLIAAWAWNRPGAAVAPGDGVVKVVVPRPAGPPVVVARLDVEADETLIIELSDGRASEDRRLAPAASGSLALLDLPEHTSSDMLGFLETLSR